MHCNGTGYVKKGHGADRVTVALHTAVHPYSCTEITNSSIWCVCVCVCVFKLRVQQGI